MYRRYRIAGLVTDLDCDYPRTIRQAEAYREDTQEEPAIRIPNQREKIPQYRHLNPELSLEDWEYVLFHAAYEMTEGTRDEDNKVVKGETKKDKVRDWLEDFDGLTDDQKEFLWESAGYKDKR